MVWNAIFYFPRNIGKFIIPIDFHIFRRGSNHQPDVDWCWLLIVKTWINLSINMDLSMLIVNWRVTFFSSESHGKMRFIDYKWNLWIIDYHSIFFIWCSFFFWLQSCRSMVNIMVSLKYVPAMFNPKSGTMTGWWFGMPFFIFPYIGNNHPNWLSYFSEGFKPPTRWFLWTRIDATGDLKPPTNLCMVVRWVWTPPKVFCFLIFHVVPPAGHSYWHVDSHHSLVRRQFFPCYRSSGIRLASVFSGRMAFHPSCSTIASYFGVSEKEVYCMYLQFMAS